VPCFAVPQVSPLEADIVVVASGLNMKPLGAHADQRR